MNITDLARAGGKAAAAKLTPEQRRERARKAAAARWANKPPSFYGLPCIVHVWQRADDRWTAELQCSVNDKYDLASASIVVGGTRENALEELNERLSGRITGEWEVRRRIIDQPRER